MRKRFNGPLAAWAYNTSIRNLWRVYPLLDVEDLMTEAWMAFNRCNRLYGDTYKQKQFAGVFRLAFYNRLNTLADQRRKSVGIAASALTSKVNLLNYCATSDNSSEQARLNELINRAPASVRKLVRVLRMTTEYNESDEVPERQPREKMNEYFCRLVGANPHKVDMVGRVLKAFGAEDRREEFV